MAIFSTFSKNFFFYGTGERLKFNLNLSDNRVILREFRLQWIFKEKFNTTEQGDRFHTEEILACTTLVNTHIQVDILVVLHVPVYDL